MLTAMRSRELMKSLSEAVDRLPEAREAAEPLIVSLFSSIWVGEISKELEPEEQVALSAHLDTCLERRLRRRR